MSFNFQRFNSVFCKTYLSILIRINEDKRSPVAVCVCSTRSIPVAFPYLKSVVYVPLFHVQEGGGSLRMQIHTGLFSQRLCFCDCFVVFKRALREKDEAVYFSDSPLSPTPCLIDAQPKGGLISEYLP